MKTFLVTVSSLCLCGILFCFWAYATGNFSTKTTTQKTLVEQATTVEEDPLCSIHVERMAMLLEMVQEWETETTQLASVPDSQQVEDECSPCEENLKHLKKARERWEREHNAQVAPVSPSDPPGITKPTPSHPSVADIEKQLTPMGIESELSEGVSTDSFDKAQQLIDDYGTEEGLRRLREMAPEAARRFERRGAPDRNVPSSNGYSDDQSLNDSP